MVGRDSGEAKEPLLLIPRRLRRYLRVLVSDQASMTLFALVGYAQDELHSAEFAEGWIRVGVGREQLMQEEGIRKSALHDHLNQLESIGAVRREQSGRVANTYIRYLPLLADELESHPSVQAAMLERFGLDVTKVQYLPDDLPENASDPGVGEYGRTEEFQEWLTSRRDMTTKDIFTRQASLVSVIAQSKQRTGARVEAQASDPKKQSTRKSDSIPVKDRGPNLVRYFHDAVEAMGFVPETNDNRKLWSLMAKLRERRGQSTRAMIDFFCSPEGWAESKKAIWQLRDALSPKIADLYRFDADVLNLMQGNQQPKRSGGAAPLKTVEEDVSF